MTPELIMLAARLWRQRICSIGMQAHPEFRKAKVTEDDIWNRMGAIRTLAASLPESEWRVA